MGDFETSVLESLARIEARLTPKTRTTKTTPKEYSAGFLKFWQVFPPARKGNKDKAFNAYLRAIKRGNTEEHIFQVAEEYAESRDVALGFAKGCEAWLNADGFNNKYAPAGVLANMDKARNKGMEGF